MLEPSTPPFGSLRNSWPALVIFQAMPAGDTTNRFNVFFSLTNNASTKGVRHLLETHDCGTADVHAHMSLRRRCACQQLAGAEHAATSKLQAGVDSVSTCADSWPEFSAPPNGRPEFPPPPNYWPEFPALPNYRPEFLAPSNYRPECPASAKLSA